jgi:hypothetical protein
MDMDPSEINFSVTCISRLSICSLQLKSRLIWILTTAAARQLTV